MNKISVADLDILTPMYSVVDEQGYTLGEKRTAGAAGGLIFNEKPAGEAVYLKPEYTKRGQRVGGKHSSWDARLYRSSPPWMKYEVFQIDRLGGNLTFHVKPGK